ncbi:MAG: hypothetical protein JWQ14_2285, partial [Adhaeribacter sp.]|nr:hypothetical protein [Adhaeribacter sp.]
MLKGFNIILFFLMLVGVGLITSSSPSEERVVTVAENLWVDSVFTS